MQGPCTKIELNSQISMQDHGRLRVGQEESAEQRASWPHRRLPGRLQSVEKSHHSKDLSQQRRQLDGESQIFLQGH